MTAHAHPKPGTVLTEDSVKLLLPGDVLENRQGLTLNYAYTDKNGWVFCDGFGGAYDRDAHYYDSFTFVSRPSLEPPASDVAGWRPIETAPKDGTPVWVAFHEDLYPRIKPGRFDLADWNGKQLCVRHPGLASDGFDLGWNVAAPVGHGGFPDEWIAGWMPLPTPPQPSKEPAPHE